MADGGRCSYVGDMIDWLEERDHRHTQSCVEYIAKHSHPKRAANDGQLVVGALLVPRPCF